jgi:putative membrane protein
VTSPPHDTLPPPSGTAGPRPDTVKWKRLHPLSPLVRAGRAGGAIVLAVVISTANRHSDNSAVVDGAVALIIVVAGVIRWLVTRWALDGVTLRIESGLLRRDSQQLPVARIQAVDVVRPLLARIFGLAELQIRLAGSSSSNGRLAYLPEQEALDLRARLLATHHGVDPATPEPPQQVVAEVPTGRLVGSVIFSGAVVLVPSVIALVLLIRVSSTAAVIFGSAFATYALGFLQGVWRRISTQYGFVVADAPDGIRISRGLLGTVAETIPVRRVQAVRLVEPLFWRLFGWCRLEVDVAGGTGREGRGRSATSIKSLLPVGSHQVAQLLVTTVIPGALPPSSAPPRRARFKAPLSYHFLAAGHNDVLAVAVTGRVRKTTTWVPLVKAQSVRRIQGPIQRRLGLATVHLDAAGRRVRAEWRDRTVEEADDLMDDLAALSRAARQREEESRTAPLPAAAGPGWFPDPAGRHQLRYWDGVVWTAHVLDASVAGDDPLPPPAPSD